MKRFLIIVFIQCIFNTTLRAQGEANIWYFGQNAGLDFNSGSPVPLSNGAINTYEGCASISNSAGALKFYTDGITVWNANHTAMPNGTGLFGDPSATQSGIIVPKPGNPNIYYVFTVAATGGSSGLNYSEVDMTLDGGLGDVTAIKNIQLASPVTEKLTGVKKSNNIDFWVIAHDDNNGFLVYSVTSAGVNTTPIVSNTGTVDNSPWNLGVGYLKASSSSNRLAHAVSNNSVVDILTFNNLTGVITNEFSFSTSCYAYGVEFSPDGSKLYVGCWAHPDIYQYNLALGTPAAIIASETIVGTASAGLGALQIAPDGKIYVAKNSTELVCINNPNALGTACNFVDFAVPLPTGLCFSGLPNFLQTFFIPPSITYNNICFGDTTNFSLSDTTALDSVLWNFGDISSGVYNTSSLFFPEHVYSNDSTFIVTAITYAGSITDTLSVTFSIIPTANINLGNDTIVCGSTPLILDAGAGFNNYLWQDGSSGQTINVNNSGLYHVTAQNQCGVATDTINVTSLPLYMTVNSPTICSGQQVLLSATGSNSYTWSTGATTNTITVSPTATTTYTVIGTDSTGCTGAITSTVTVNPLPQVNAGQDVNLCSGSTIQLTASGGVNYVWSPANGLSNDSIANPVCSVSVNTVYTVTAVGLNNCVNSDQLTVTVVPSPVANFSFGNACEGVPVQFNNLTTGTSNSQTWNFGDGGTSAAISPVHTYAVAGNYNVTLTANNNNGCSSATSIPLQVNTSPTAPVLNSNSPVCTGDLININSTALGNMQYSWSGPSGFNGNNPSVSIASATPAMSGMYYLTIIDIASGCKSDSTGIDISINVSPATPQIEATDKFCFGDTIKLLTPDIAYSYSWQGPESFTSSIQNPTIVPVSEKNAGTYLLIVIDTNACSAQANIDILFECEDSPELFVPNVFTPNGDNENEVFKIVNADLSTLNVQIFDRWGLNLYTWDNINGSWNGKSNQGADVPSGTYYYLVNATTKQGKAISKQGFFTLFR